ncbi:MAG TPA: hypothetical protein VJL37_00690 [Flavobacterium sp.]|nr:hypothetical protein [Flavobacterium sp.]
MKRTNLKSLLGITQQDAAIILQVSRSQISLYDLHLRDLPTAAMIKLTQGWHYAEAKVKLSKENSTHCKEEEKRMKEFLKAEIQNNELEQLKIRRQIEKLSEKYDSTVRGLHALEFWKQQVKDASSKEMQILTLVEERTKRKLDDCSWHIQEQYRMKLETLEHYGKMLVARSKE